MSAATRRRRSQRMKRTTARPRKSLKTATFRTATRRSTTTSGRGTDQTVRGWRWGRVTKGPGMWPSPESQRTGMLNGAAGSTPTHLHTHTHTPHTHICIATPSFLKPWQSNVDNFTSVDHTKVNGGRTTSLENSSDVFLAQQQQRGFPRSTRLLLFSFHRTVICFFFEDFLLLTKLPACSSMFSYWKTQWSGRASPSCTVS